MEVAAGRLTLARADRGALDFDLPEARIAVDGGLPVKVEAVPRWESHRLIEEFMLLANTAVAEFLSERAYPFLSRIHEPPAEDRMEEFEDAASRLLRRGKVTERRDVSSRLQAWARAARGGKYEKHINMLLLRSLMLARYGPEQLGHFGLALTQYTHFTSPIRRYPDLIVHRVLKAALGEKSLSSYAAALKEKGDEIGRHLSARERTAMEAERDVEQRAKALYLSTRVGETFTGVISSIVAFGFFVDLLECFAEGFIHISTLRDDDYRYSAERGDWYGALRKNRFSLGDRLRVRLRRADVDRGEIDLVFIEKLPESS
jgi:ribonuclease R